MIRLSLEQFSHNSSTVLWLQRISAPVVSLIVLVIVASIFIFVTTTWNNYHFQDRVPNTAPVEGADTPKAVFDTRHIVLDQQNERSDGVLVTDTVWYRQELRPESSLNWSEVSGIELFLIAGKRYSLLLQRCEKTKEAPFWSTTFTASAYGFQTVDIAPSISPESTSSICLYIAGTTDGSADIGTSSPSTNPYPGDFEVSIDGGASWRNAERDLSFKLLGKETGEEDGVLFTKYGSFGDGKFVQFEGRNFFLTTRDGRLEVVSLEERTIEMTGISIDWFASATGPQGALILGSSELDRRLRLYKFDNTNPNGIQSIGGVLNSDALKIDPALSYSPKSDTWYATFTTVEGTVNRRDESQSNGRYTLNFISSRDLSHWTDPLPLLQLESNIEDARMVVLPDTGELLIVVEVETRDQGESWLRMIRGNPAAMNRASSELLRQNRGDNEPAALIPLKDKFALFYSSDYHNPGASYEGAEGFVQLLSLRDLVMEPSVRLPGLPTGILLLDVAHLSEKNVLLAYLEDYSGRRVLTVRRSECAVCR
jgi:hypothetical protein